MYALLEWTIIFAEMGIEYFIYDGLVTNYTVMAKTHDASGDHRAGSLLAAISR